MEAVLGIDENIQKQHDIEQRAQQNRPPIRRARADKTQHKQQHAQSGGKHQRIARNEKSREKRAEKRRIKPADKKIKQ